MEQCPRCDALFCEPTITAVNTEERHYSRSEERRLAVQWEGKYEELKLENVELKKAKRKKQMMDKTKEDYKPDCCDYCKYCQCRWLKKYQDNIYRCKIMKYKTITTKIEEKPDWCPFINSEVKT